MELKLEAERHADYAERVDAVMRAARTHWLVVDEQEQFKAACGALLVVGTDEEREEISYQLKQMAALSALMSGIPVDLEQLAAEQEQAPAPKVLLRDRWVALRKDAA
jgi:hypothetical protein